MAGMMPELFDSESRLELGIGHVDVLLSSEEEKPESYSLFSGQPVRYAAPYDDRIGKAQRLATQLGVSVADALAAMLLVEAGRAQTLSQALMLGGVRQRNMFEGQPVRYSLFEGERPVRYTTDKTGREHDEEGLFVGKHSSSENEDEDEDEEETAEDILEGLGFDRDDLRQFPSLENTKTIVSLSRKPKETESVSVSSIRGHEDTEDSDPIDDPDEVPPIIVGHDGDLIDGNHRLSGILKAGGKKVNVIYADENDLKAAKEFGGLQGRGSWSEEAWIKWMLARQR